MINNIRIYPRSCFSCGVKLTNTHIVVNTLKPRQDGRYFAYDTSKRIFVNEKVRIFIELSLKFVPKGQINNIQHWFR